MDNPSVAEQPRAHKEPDASNYAAHHISEAFHINFDRATLIAQLAGLGQQEGDRHDA